MAFQFTWKCSYLGEIWYQCDGTDADRTGLLVLREPRLSDGYEKSTMDSDYWEANVLPLMYAVRWYNDPNRPVPGDVVAAFNAWRDAEWRAVYAHIAADPERYGEIDAADEIRRSRVPVFGAWLARDQSRWQFAVAPPASAAG